MLYKPKYCSNCGERIERTDWKLFSSRRFCPLCETEFVFEEWLPRVAALFLIAFGIWGFGSLFLRTGETLVVREKNASAEANEISKRSLKTSPANPNKSAPGGEAAVGNPSPANLADKTLPSPENSAARIKSSEKTQKASAAAVYFCGAETKKGTPCSRRVKGGGRCWQHKGRNAILPAKDLLADEQR